MVVTEPDLRQTYFDLARQWRDMAAQVEELTNGTVKAPNGNGRPALMLSSRHKATRVVARSERFHARQC